MRPSPRQSCLWAACLCSDTPQHPSTPSSGHLFHPCHPSRPCSGTGPLCSPKDGFTPQQRRSPAWSLNARANRLVSAFLQGAGARGTDGCHGRICSREGRFPGAAARPAWRQVLAGLQTPCADPGSTRDVPKAPRGIASCTARSDAATVLSQGPLQSSAPHRSRSPSRCGQSHRAPSTSHGEGPPSTRPHCTGWVRYLCVHRYLRIHRLQTCALVGSTHGNVPHKQAPI